MTIQFAIEQIDRQVINNIEEADKIKWLTDLDRTIWKTIVSKSRTDTAEPDFDKYGLDTVLLAVPPFDEVYRWYLEMQIHGINGESARYNIAVAKYNYAYQALLDDINRNYGASKVTRMRWW